ncbi:MAG: sigma-70 family RNA polymerase sigma factor [Planctomycetia bacterium]|nr:sigma-70 family RNA polymerase sigma factor [Planctomycetia bacterium]
MGDSPDHSSGVGFPTTLWSQVLSAGRGSARAFEALARRYRPVVLTLVRWSLRLHGPARVDPEDVVQDFFLHLTERRGAILGRADRTRGRFRAWLRACLRNWLLDWSEQARRRERGAAAAGGAGEIAGDEMEREFDRQWARDVMDSAMRRLQEDAGTRALEAHDLRVWQLKHGGDDPSAREIAMALGLPENAVVVSLRRTRRRFRIHLEAEVEATVTSREELEEEIRDLRRAAGA